MPNTLKRAPISRVFPILYPPVKVNRWRLSQKEGLVGIVDLGVAEALEIGGQQNAVNDFGRIDLTRPVVIERRATSELGMRVPEQHQLLAVSPRQAARRGAGEGSAGDVP